MSDSQPSQVSEPERRKAKLRKTRRRRARFGTFDPATAEWRSPIGKAWEGSAAARLEVLAPVMNAFAETGHADLATKWSNAISGPQVTQAFVDKIGEMITPSFDVSNFVVATDRLSLVSTARGASSDFTIGLSDRIVKNIAPALDVSKFVRPQVEPMSSLLGSFADSVELGLVSGTAESGPFLEALRQSSVVSTRAAGLGLAEQLGKSVVGAITSLTKATADVGLAAYFQPTMPIVEALGYAGLGRFAEVDCAARLAEQFTSATTSRLASIAVNPFLDGLQSATDGIFAHLQNLQVLADSGSQVGRAAMAVVRRAREAVLRGEHELVREFVRRILGYKVVSATLLDAAIGALLDPRWENTAPGKVIASLRTMTEQYHNTHRPIGETRIRGRYVDSLDRPIRTPGVEGILGDLVVAPILEYDDDITNPRLLAAMQSLTPVQREIVLAKAGGAPTWAAAATEVGQKGEAGESVRRKVCRLRSRGARVVEVVG